MHKYFFIRTTGKYVKISFAEIVFVEGCRNYIKIATDHKVHLVLFSMKGLEKFLPKYCFQRIHKSFIVSLDKITGFDADRVYLKDKELPIGQQYRGELEKAVLIANDTICGLEAVDSTVYPIPLVINATQKSRLFEAG